MKELFLYFYNGLLRFTPLTKYFQFKSNRKGIFPSVGFLSQLRKEELENSLDIKIKNVEFFEQALIHRSYVHICDDVKLVSNERLEFLGDAVLGLIIAEHLFASYPDVPEGELTKMRSWLVNRRSLSICAKKLKLDSFLMMSFSAAKSIEHGSESILADGLEAIIAAIYLDSNLEYARNFVLNSLIPIMENKHLMVDDNFKSILLENVQACGLEFPKYIVLSEEGPDHNKEFTIGVYIQDEIFGIGKGKSKKQAEQIAAQLALQRFKSVYSKNN